MPSLAGSFIAHCDCLDFSGRTDYLQVIGNAGVHRILAVRRAKRNGTRDHQKLAEIAYPPRDRPRHDRDLASVVFHASTSKKVSPVVIARIRTGRSVRYILLDGVHRLVSVAIRGGPVKVAILPIQ